MAESSLIIAAIALIVAAVIAFRIIKSILKTAVLLIAILSVALGVGAFLAVMDFNDFKDNFESGKNLFLVIEDNTVISAIEAERGETKAVNQQQTDEYSSKLKEGERQGLREDYYKLIIMHIATFAEEDSALAEKLKSETYPEEKARMLTPLIEKVFSDPVFLLTQYKKGNIEVYGETAMFKAMKLLPLSLIKSAANKAVSKTKSIVVEKIE